VIAGFRECGIRLGPKQNSIRAIPGGGDPDPHVPWQRVAQSAAILAEMGAAVTSRRYANLPHTISSQEIDLAKRLLLDAYGTKADSSDARVALN